MLKPSERIKEIAKENDWRIDGLVRDYPRDLSAHVAELTTRLDAVSEYLDERETQLHPIAMTCCGGNDETPQEHTQDCSCDCGHELADHGGHVGNSSECDKCSCSRFTPDAPPRAHPAPTSSPGEDNEFESLREKLFLSEELNRKLGEEVSASGLQKRRELDEELQQIDDAVVAAGGTREQGAVAFLAALGTTHEGLTAAEWASRYADLANAAAGAVGVLAVNDPAQRMVKERLEGVLAGR